MILLLDKFRRILLIKTKPDMPQHILLIEDDLVDQMAFRRMMKKKHPDLPYEIANSIEQARACLQQANFTCIIIDFQLGDGTALDLLPFPIYF